MVTQAALTAVDQISGDLTVTDNGNLCESMIDTFLSYVPVLGSIIRTNNAPGC